MSKQSTTKYAAVKNVFGKFIFTILVFATVSTARAQSTEMIDSTGDNAKVEYLGIYNDMSLFRVRFNNDPGEKYSVMISDSTGDILFKGVYNEKAFDKKFVIPKDIQKLNFVLKGLKDKSVRTFVANTTVYVTEDMVVNRVR